MEIKTIQWGFSTIGCPELTLSEAEALGRCSGYPLLEVRIADDTFSDVAVLKLLAAQKRCFILGSSFGLITDDDIYREKLKNIATLAARCNIPYVRIFGGCAYAEPENEEKLRNAQRNLDFFEGLNLPVQLVLETHDFFSSARRIYDLFQKTGRKLPVIWDTYHTYFSGKEPLQKSWELLSEHIIDIHVKDGSSSGLTLPGNGVFPFSELFELLKKNRYSGMITCEHEKMWHPELPELKEAFRALDVLKKASGFL